MSYDKEIQSKLINVLENIDFSRIFVIDENTGKEYTYGDIFSASIRIADLIETMKMPLLAIMDNSTELLCMLLATSMTDVSIACVDPQKGPDEILGIVNECPERAISYAGNDDRVKQFLSNRMLFESVPVGENADPSAVKAETIRRYSHKDFSVPYLVTYTSGTSGKTKGVVHSFGSLLGAAFSLNRLIPLDDERRLLHMMPMTYMAGILNSVFYPMIGCASIIVGSRFSVQNASLFWKKVDRYSANVFWVSPSMLKMIMMFDRAGTGCSYCAKQNVIFLVGTAALDETLRHDFNTKYNVNVLAGYGLSETLFVSMETMDSLKNREKGSVGVFLDEVVYAIPEDTELQIKVPWMYLGYTNEDEKEYFAGDYYKSGDLVSVRGNQLYITGRKKDLIIKGGMNISPKLIEDCIISHAAISECSVFPVKTDGEEKVCCAYVTKPGYDESIEKELRELVFDQLGRNYSIDQFWRKQELSRNLNGKIDKLKMRREWEAEHLETD